jgi:hypothetical protein
LSYPHIHFNSPPRHLEANRNGSAIQLSPTRLIHHLQLPLYLITADAMATAVAASAFLPSAFATRRYRLARPAPRRAAAAGLAIRCETSDKQKRQPLEAFVPREERFMFEGDELCGPVQHPLSFLS